MMNYAKGMVQRLAATIPKLSEDQTTSAALKQLAGDVATTECMKDLLVLTIIVVMALELLSHLVYRIPKCDQQMHDGTVRILLFWLSMEC